MSKPRLHLADIEKAIKAFQRSVELAYYNGKLYWIVERGKPMASLRRSIKPKAPKVPKVPGMKGVSTGMTGMGGLGGAGAAMKGVMPKGFGPPKARKRRTF